MDLNPNQDRRDSSRGQHNRPPSQAGSLSGISTCTTLIDIAPENFGTGEPYSYTPLEGADALRLINILPGKPEEPVQISISHHNIRAQYVALSYTWDDPGCGQVTCDDRVLVVPADCELFLRCLRQAGRLGPFWIDALCIDQEQAPEKSQQVARIGDTFSHAQKVIVFLGQHDECSRSTFFVSQQRDLVRDIRHLRVFFTRPWFTRTWSTPETMLARDVEIFVASSVVESDRLPDIWTSPQAILDWVEDLQRRAKAHIQLPEIFALHSRFSDLDYRAPPFKPDPLRYLGRQTVDASWAFNQSQGIRTPLLFEQPACDPPTYDEMDLDKKGTLHTSRGSFGRLEIPLWRFFEVLHSTRMLRCRDPRDKMYAILPLFTRPTPKALTVDYSKSHLEVFANAMWLMIDYGVDDALSVAGITRDNSGFPSWVVDWESTQMTQPLRSAWTEREWTAGFTRDHKRIVASRQDRRLKLRGRLVSTVVVVKEESSMDGSCDQYHLSDALRQIGTWTKCSREEVLADDATAFVSFFDNMLRMVYLNLSDIHKAQKQLATTRHPSVMNQNAPAQPGRSAQRELINCCTNRRPIVLENYLVGIGPLLTRPQDYVCIFLGFKTPFVIRKISEDEWVLVGECLIEGLMRGEGIADVNLDRDDAETPEAPLQDFVIV